jgi:hypothetical protein
MVARTRIITTMIIMEEGMTEVMEEGIEVVVSMWRLLLSLGRLCTIKIVSLIWGTKIKLR